MADVKLEPGVNSRPRVNGATIGSHVGATVCLVGKVTKKVGQAPEDGVMTVEASDGKPVSVHTAQTAPFSATYVEIYGVVNGDQSVRATTITPLGDAFDLNNYNELVQISQKLPDLF